MTYSSCCSIEAQKPRVARWFIFIPKIPACVCILQKEGLGMENVDIFDDHLEYVNVIWYI
jgi:hypothetical protein